MVKISYNNIELIKNSNKIELDGKKGAIVKIIAYLLFRSKDNLKKDVLNYKIIGGIEGAISDTKFNTGDYIITSDKASSLFECIYNNQENYSASFQIKNKKIFPRVFQESFFISDEDLKNYYSQTSEEYIKEINKTYTTYPLKNFITIIKDLQKDFIEIGLLNSNLQNKILDTSLNIRPVLMLHPLPNSNEILFTKLNTKTTIPDVKSYDIKNPKDRHICLQTDKEFEKQCSEVHEIRNSKFCLPRKEDDLIQAVIYGNRNYWDVGLLEKADKILKENSVVIDIGSNIGNHSLYWANERNAKRIYAFEPYPYSYKILEKNVKINNLEERMKIFPFGISDEESKGSVIGFCETNIGGTGFEKDENGDFDFKALDSLMIPEKIDLIKIDVEGAELNVLNGGMETIKKNLPVIIIETFSNKDKIEEMLFPLGYELVDDNRVMCDYIYGCRSKF